MVFDDEARQPLLAGVSKLARAVRSTLGPPRPQCGARQGLGRAEGDQGRRDRRRRHRAGRSVRKPGRPARQGSRQQDQRRRRRRHDHGHRAGRGHLPRRLEDDFRRRRPDGAVAAASTRPRAAVVEAIKQAGHADQRKEQERNQAGRHDRRQQRSQRSATCWPKHF